MSTRWNEAFARLQDFIKAHPEISIGDVVTVIPGEVRPEFYRLFDEVRTTFVEENFPGLLKEAEILGSNYRLAEQEVKETLNLEGVYTLGFLDRFLHEPTKELTRELFSPLFDLLKGRVSPAAFEAKGVKDIRAIAANSQRLGYAKWVALSLVKQLQADKVFSIAPPESKLDGHGDPLCCEMAVNYPEESKILTFEHGPDHFPPFITPHFIIHSAKLGRYVAFRSEMYKAEYIALNTSEKREWYRISSMAREYKEAFTNPSLIIYVGDSLEDMALIADKDRMNRPDMIVDLREPGDWEGQETPPAAKLYDILNPKMGRYIISREPVPVKLSQQNTMEEDPSLPGVTAQKKVVITPVAGEAGNEEQPGDKVFTVGYDQAKLQPVIEGFNRGQEIDNLAGQGAV